MKEKDATYSELRTYRTLFFVVGMRESCQKENEPERIRKRKMDEEKEGRNKATGETQEKKIWESYVEVQSITKLNSAFLTILFRHRMSTFLDKLLRVV